MYAFMHCWEPSFDQWVAQPLEGELLSGTFNDDNANEVSQEVRCRRSTTAGGASGW